MSDQAASDTNGQSAIPTAMEATLADILTRLAALEAKFTELSGMQPAAKKPRPHRRLGSGQNNGGTITTSYVDDGKEIGLAPDDDARPQNTPSTVDPVIARFNTTLGSEKALERISRKDEVKKELGDKLLSITIQKTTNGDYEIRANIALSRKGMLPLMGFSPVETEQVERYDSGKKLIIKAALAQEACKRPLPEKEKSR